MPAPLPMGDKFEWERLVRRLPSDSPLFRHDRCGNLCTRWNGSKLSARTLKICCYALSTFANADGRKAHPGVGLMVTATSCHKDTVVRALRHLEIVRLIAVTLRNVTYGEELRGGRTGVPREWATVYYLAIPDFADLQGVIEGEVYDFFIKPRESG